MNKILTRRMILGLVLLASGLLAGAAPTIAQGEGPAPTAVIVVGNTRFAPLFEAVTLAPGQTMQRDLKVGGFSHLSLLAAAASAPNNGRVAVRTIFGPPAVPVPNGLDLAFGGRRSTRDSAFIPVAGPKLVIEVTNRSAQPIEISLSVLARK